MHARTNIVDARNILLHVKRIINVEIDRQEAGQEKNPIQASKSPHGTKFQCLFLLRQFVLLRAREGLL